MRLVKLRDTIRDIKSWPNVKGEHGFPRGERDKKICGFERETLR